MRKPLSRPKSKTSAELSRHPFGIIREAERHEKVCGCSHSHRRRRNAPWRTPGCNLSPALDLDVKLLNPNLATTPSRSDKIQLPGEAESGSAGVQPDKEYPGRRCANGASGLWPNPSGASFLLPLGTGAMPQKTHLVSLLSLLLGQCRPVNLLGPAFPPKACLASASPTSHAPDNVR